MIERRKFKRDNPLVKRALIVEDDIEYANHIKRMYSNYIARFDYVRCPLEMFRSNLEIYDWIFLDVVFNGKPAGLKIPERLKRYNPTVTIILMTAFPNYKEESLELLKKGEVTWVIIKNGDSQQIAEDKKALRYALPLASRIDNLIHSLSGCFSG